MVFNIFVGNLIIDIGVVIIILLILKIFKIPMIIALGEKSTCVRNEELKDEKNIFNKFLTEIGLLKKTGHEWKIQIIDKEIRNGLQEIKIVAGEISKGTRKIIDYCLEKRIRVFVVSGRELDCPTEDLEKFITNPNFKLRTLEKRPKSHKTIIGRNILLEEFHAPGEPYKKALGIEKPYTNILDYHTEDFESLFSKAQEIKSRKDLQEKTVCLL